MDPIGILVLAVAAGLAARQLRRTLGHQGALLAKLRDPAFRTKLETGQREAARAELAATEELAGHDADDDVDALMDAWNRHGRRHGPAPGMPAAPRFDCPWLPPLMLTLALLALAGVLRLL